MRIYFLSDVFGYLSSLFDQALQRKQNIYNRAMEFPFFFWQYNFITLSYVPEHAYFSWKR